MIKSVERIDFLNFREIIRKFHPESQYFEFCNGYIAQAIRNFPRVFYFDKDTLVFFTRKDIKKSSFVIVCSAGRNRVKAVKELASILFKRSKEKVIIKNVDKELENLAKFKGFRCYNKNETWDSFSKYNDNTFPQVVVDVNKEINLENPEIKNLRYELSLFDRKFDIKIRRYMASDKKLFSLLLNEWALKMGNLWGLKKNELIRCQKMFGMLRNDFFQYIIYEKRTRKYIGFISLSVISESCVGHNALIYDFNNENLSRKLMQEAVKIAARLGFEFINLQGSEDKDQFESKMKFKPHILLDRKHIVYEE